MRSLSAHAETLLAPKLTTAEQAVGLVKPGNRVFVGTACASPRKLVAALEARRPTPPDVELVHFLTSGLSDLWVTGTSRFRHRCFFVGSDVRKLVQEGQAEYVPISLSQVSSLAATGRVAPDVAFIQVTPPDAHGYVSLGISVDVTMGILANAKTIVAEINPQMPRTLGDSFIPFDRIAAAVLVDEPLIDYRHEPADEVAQKIARFVAEIIDDGATLHVDLGRIPNETLKHLHHRRDIGIHTNVITEPLLELIEKGVVTGRRKTIHAGKVVTSFCIGTKRLYDALHDNPLFEFHPIEYVADPSVVARNHRMVSLTQAFAIDLTGQVCADQFQGEFYSGVSNQLDFHRGTALAPGGKPILCLRSTTDDGAQSRIRPRLLEGEGVTLARSDVHYVVTEYGMAYLFGKSVRERAIALIEIAHPAFREKLLEEAKRLALVPAAHKLVSKGDYLVDEERTITLGAGRTVRLRPARGGDVPALQRMFHRMSSQDIYMRFFRRASSLSYEEAQRLCNVDFVNDVAFVAVVGPREAEEIVGTAAYFLNPSTNLAETAFMNVPDWQGVGLGGAFQQRLKEFAVARGVRGFVSEVMNINSAMIALARQLGEISVSSEDGALHIVSIFNP